MHISKLIIGAVITALIAAGVSIWLSKDEPESPLSARQPLLSLQEILAARDLEQAAYETAETNQPQALSGALAMALEVARQAGLSQKDLDYLQSESARNYLLFKARRKIFFNRFEQHYLALEPIDGLKREFPEAQDLFARADQMVQQRDEQILAIAQQLAGQQGNVDQYLAIARQQWSERAKANATVER